MALTHHISTSIQINAPPEVVRATMLDFPSYPQWASAHIRSIEIVDNKTSSTINTDGPPVGSKLKVVLKSMTFNPVVVTNTPTEFAWLGQFVIPKVLFDGKHSFVFKPIEGNKTEVIQSEDFVGVLCTLMKYGSWGQETSKGFESFNQELKQRCEAEMRGQ